MMIMMVYNDDGCDDDDTMMHDGDHVYDGDIYVNDDDGV